MPLNPSNTVRTFLLQASTGVLEIRRMRTQVRSYVSRTHRRAVNPLRPVLLEMSSFHVVCRSIGCWDLEFLVIDFRLNTLDTSARRLWPPPLVIPDVTVPSAGYSTLFPGFRDSLLVSVFGGLDCHVLDVASCVYPALGDGSGWIWVFSLSPDVGSAGHGFCQGFSCITLSLLSSALIPPLDKVMLFQSSLRLCILSSFFCLFLGLDNFYCFIFRSTGSLTLRDR